MPVGLNSFDHARFGVITEVLVYRYIPEELTVSLMRVVQEQWKTMTIEIQSCSENLAAHI